MNGNRNLTITFLERILDFEDMDQKQKAILKNFMIPALEYIDDSASPKDAMTRIHLLSSIYAVPAALAIDSAIHEKGYREARLTLAKDFYNGMKAVGEILKEVEDKKKKENRK